MGMTINGSSGLVFPDSTTMITGAQAVKAWVNFNGTGTVAIRASYNVTSITDNGTGDYTVNFTTAMPDADYVVVVTAGGTNIRINASSPRASGGDPTTTSTSLATYIDSTSSNTDSRYVNVAIFR